MTVKEFISSFDGSDLGIKIASYNTNKLIIPHIWKIDYDLKRADEYEYKAFHKYDDYEVCKWYQRDDSIYLYIDINTDMSIKEENEGEGIYVKDLIKLLDMCPKDAKILITHKSGISSPKDDGTIITGWVFDTVCEARCEKIIDKERYPDYKSDDKIVWLRYQYE